MTVPESGTALTGGLACEGLCCCAGLEKGGAFNRCRFARDGSTALFTTVNQRGEGYILRWDQVRILLYITMNSPCENSLRFMSAH